jgi:hypothetical protein
MAKYATSTAPDITAAAMNAQVEFFMYEGIPFRIADSPKLQQWLDLLRRGDGAVAKRKQMVGLAYERSEKVRDAVIERLHESEWVTVGVDGWTNVNGHKVLNLVPVAGGVAYYWNSVVLKHHSAAADQEQPVLEALDKLIKRSVRVTAIVTDNEQVNIALFNRLLPTFPFLLHIPCAAHTIQLCVNKAIKLKGVFKVQDALIALLAAYKASKTLRVKLVEQQGLLRDGSPLRLVKANDTRWNSLLEAAERVVELSPCITPYIPIIKQQLGKTKSSVKRERWMEYTFSMEEFWQPLESLIKFLQPYKVATDVVQSDASTPADIHQQFGKLVAHADALAPPHFLAPLRVKLLRIIKTQWDTHVNTNTIITSAHLSLDSSYDSFSDEERATATDWFLEWGTKYLHFYHLGADPKDDAETINICITRQYGEFNRKSGAFAGFKATHAKLSRDWHVKQEKLPAKDRRRYNPRDTWMTCQARELATLALALLSVTASEAAVERSFSRQGIIHSKLRNRLSDESVNMQMFFSFNTRALEQPNRHHGASVADIEEKDEEACKQTALLSSANYIADDEIIAASDEEVEPQGEVGDEKSEEVAEEAAEEVAEEELELDDEDAEEEEKSGKEEKEQPVEKSEEEKLQEFILEYVERTRLVRGRRWAAWERSALQAQLLSAGIKTLEGDVIARLKKYAGEREEE